MLSSPVFKSLQDLLSVSLPFILWDYASQKAKRAWKPRQKLMLLIEKIKWKW
jgi:hypothetical protein